MLRASKHTKNIKISPSHSWTKFHCQTPFTRYNRLSIRLYNRFDNRLYRVNGASKWSICTRQDLAREHSTASLIMLPLRSTFAKSVTVSVALSTSIICRWKTLATRYITANMLQTMVDAQCDKLATELSWQRLRRSIRFRVVASYLSKVANFNLPHLYLAPPLGMTPFEFCRPLRHQNTRPHSVSYGVICVILRLVVSVEHRLVTDRQRDTGLRHIPR